MELKRLPRDDPFPKSHCQRIVQSACTDGGQTGRTLRLVSGAFHEILNATSLDLHTVAVFGGEEILRFEEMLRERSGKGFPRNVQGLFISNLQKDLIVPELGESSRSQTSSLQSEGQNCTNTKNGVTSI